MISTVTLTFDLTYTNPLTGALEPRGIVTDSTDYAGLGIDLNIREAKGLGVITFNGDVIVDLDTIGDPMINLQDWEFENPGVTPFFAFSLTLDTNGNIANGVYTLNYSLRLTGTNQQILSNTAPDVIVTDGSLWLNDFLQVGNTLTLVGGTNEDVTVISAVDSDPDVTITTSDYTLDPIDSFEFDITNTQLNAVYTYSGCVQSAAEVAFSYDCEVGTNGTWAVANTTVLNGQTITSLSATINYPAWTSLTPTFNSQIVTNSLPYSNNVLATGTFSVSLSQVIQKVQADGLILQYISSGVHEFVVSCAGSLCNLIPCIESLRNVHATELQRNRISKYQVFVDNVLLYYTEAQNYRSCGDIENYRKTLALIETQLDASGCECGCCDPDTYQWVNNNAASTIDTLINAIQFRLFALTPPGPGSPLPTNDETQGVQVGALWQNVDTQIIYICTVNDPGEAEWEEYYAPGQLPTASEIPADPGVILTSGFVQGQLNQIDTLAVFDGINGLNKVGNDVRLGGTLDDDTTIDVNGNDFIITSDDGTLEVIATAGIPLLLNVNQNSSAVGINAVLTTTNTAGAAANGIGSSIQFVAENAAGTPSLTSTIKSTWVDASVSNSNFQITTKNANVESPVITLNPDGSLTLNEYNGTTFEDPVPAYLLGVDASGNVVQVPSANALVFSGRTRFSGPSIQLGEFYNNTGATVTMSNSGTGVYTINASAAAFTTNATAFIQLQSPGFVTVVRTNDTTLTVNTYDTAGVANDAVVTGAFVKIEVYP